MLKYYRVSDTKWLIWTNQPQIGWPKNYNFYYLTRNDAGYGVHVYGVHVYLKWNYYHLQNQDETRSKCLSHLSLYERLWPGSTGSKRKKNKRKITTSLCIYGVIKINYVIICFGFIAITVHSFVCEKIRCGAFAEWRTHQCLVFLFLSQITLIRKVGLNLAAVDCVS